MKKIMFHFLFVCGTLPGFQKFDVLESQIEWPPSQVNKDLMLLSLLDEDYLR